MRKLLLTLWVSLGFVLVSYAQKTISGNVTDQSGAPLSKVSVIVKGSNVGTTTDASGNFSLSIPASAKQIEFSILGYETQTLNANSTKYRVILATSDAKALTDVVVTGVSKIKKSQYTGAAGKINEKELKNQPAGSFDQIFQGRVAGVAALTGSGAPGSASNVIIRGQGSITGGSDPLYVVDGIIVETGIFQGLDPNNFASVDILRDASAAALYGSRGSQGVIVVTTKRGVAGKTRFGYSSQFGVKSKPDFAFTPMNTTQLLASQKDYGRVTGDNTNANVPGWFYSSENPRYASLSAADKALADRTLDSISRINTNWQDQIFRNGNFSNHQITLSGGNAKTRFYSALSLYNEEGITLRTDMNRVTLQNNIDFSDDKLTFGVSSNMSYTRRNFQQSTTGNNLGNPFLSSVVNVPYALVKDANGKFATGVGPSFAAANQLDITNLDKNYSGQLKANLSVTGSYKIWKGLSAGITTGVDFRETQSSIYGSPLAFTRTSSTSITGRAGFQEEGLTRSFIATVRPSLGYKTVIQEKHDIEVNAYADYVTEFNKSFSGREFGVNPKTPNTLAGTTQGDINNQLFGQIAGGKTQNASSAGLLVARYTYNNKYTFSGSFRREGSTKLPEATRHQSFFSLGGVWEASKETFIQKIKAINTLRVKLSYGSTGNSDNFPQGDFGYLPQYGQGTYNGNPTYGPTGVGNNELKWETTYTTNFGIDYEILNRRVYGDINVYNKLSKDVFIQKGLAFVAGTLPFPDQNVGQVSNKGVELTLTGEVINKNGFVWSVTGNVAYNKNRIKDLGGIPAYENPSGTDYIQEGIPLGSHYEVAWAGVDAATGQPLYYTKDGRITNVRSADDRTTDFGTWEAPWKGGFGTSVRYKGFELSSLFSWQRGATKVDNMEFFVENPAGFLASGYNQSADLKFWQKPGDIVNTPNPLYGTNFSSKIIHDASFLRLREVRLQYTLPSDIVKKTKIVSSARFYVLGNNLFIWTKWRGLDPEAGATNINLSEFPNPRSITAGLELNF